MNRHLRFLWAAFVAVLLAGAPTPAFAVLFQTIFGDNPSSKLTKIHIGADLAFQAFHRTVPGSGQFYPTGLDSPADMGIFVRMGGVLYSPDFAAHAGTATGGIGTHTPFTPVSFSGLSGNGSPGTPYTYTVVADAGTTGLRITVTVTYVNTENFFRHNMQFTNVGMGSLPCFDVFVGSDIYLANSDNGYPIYFSASGSVGGKDSTGNYYVLHFPLTPATYHEAKFYGSVWASIGTGDLDNVVTAGIIDNGAALEWKNICLVGPGQTAQIQAATSFGDVPTVPTTSKPYYVNKDIKNMTGETAAGVEIEVAGHHTYNDIYHATTPGFTVDATGANDKLRWTGGTILAGDVVHVGFRTDASVINILGVRMLDGGGASIGCALQLNTHVHTNTSLTWDNTVTNCTASPMYVKNVTLEYYFDEVPLRELVAGGARTPFHTDTLGMAATLIAPSGTLTVPKPAAPNGARWMVVHQEIGSTAALVETEDWVEVPVEIPPCSRLYTVTNANQLAAIDVDNACATTIIGVTRDTASGPVRRIRGLAYDAVSDNMYGMTREGDLVTVNRLTAATTFLFAVSPHGSPPNFWSGLAFDGTNKLYSTNAFGAHELVEITNVTSATVVGSTTFNGNPLQILGLDFYPSSAPLVPPTFNGTHPAPSVLYGSNRNNDNIVVVNAGNGAVTMPMGNHTVGVNNLQEIAFHPQTGVLYAIHDHFSSSNNAALSTYNFTTEMSTELCELPFGIVETVGGGNDTYGWGGLAFAPCPPTSTPTPTPTATPCSLSISGIVRYCPNPGNSPVPMVTMTLTGSAAGATTTDANGNYTFSSLPCGGSYTVTPTKAAVTPGTGNITGPDAIAIQRHFLVLGTPLAGCRLIAADVNGIGGVDGIDAVATQRFFLGLTSGVASVGKYKFIPVSRSYPGLVTNQTAQDYDALVFGDVVSGFVHRPGGSSLDAVDDVEAPSTVATVTLPEVAVDQSKNNFIAAVTTSAIDAQNKLVGFQGDFTFDERVIAFQSEPVQKAGLTGGNWNVSGNVLPVQPGAGPIRTLRISAYSNDFAPLSGSGTLFELKMTRVSRAVRGTQLLWAAPPDDFIFIDADLKTQKPGKAAQGSVTPSGEAQVKPAPPKPKPARTSRHQKGSARIASGVAAR